MKHVSIYRPNRSVMKPPNRPPIIPPRANMDTDNELEKTIVLKFKKKQKTTIFLQDKCYSCLVDFCIIISSMTGFINKCFNSLENILLRKSMYYNQSLTACGEFL